MSPAILGITAAVIFCITQGIAMGLNKKQILLVTAVSLIIALTLAGIFKLQYNKIKGRTYVQYDSYNNF